MSILDVAIGLSFWGPVVLFSIGVPSAFFNTIIFIGVRQIRQSSITYYVVGQTIADVSSLLIVLLQTISSTSMSTSPIACKLMIYSSQVAVSCAMTFLCLSAFDRWACTSRSARIRELSSTLIARRLFLVPFILWSLICIPYLIFTDLVPPTYACLFTNYVFAQIATYFLAPIFSAVFPLTVLIIFGILTYRNIHLVTNANQQLVRTRLSMWEQQMTRMMIVQTLLSILCTLPRAILIIYTIATIEQRATRSFYQITIELLLDQLTLFILCINFVSSFYIFLFSSPRLRQTIKMYLKRLFNLGHNQVGPMPISLTALPLRATQNQERKY